MQAVSFRSVIFLTTSLLCCALLPTSGVAQEAGLPPLAIRSSSSLSRAFLRQTYRVQLEAENGTTPYKWSVTGGSLPQGLVLTEEGVLSGRPTETGQFHFVVTVTDSTKPAQEEHQEFALQVLASLLAKWDAYPKVNDQRIEGSIKVSNQTDDSFDLTVIVLAVNEIGRATALGYQRFTLEKNKIDMQVPFGENLPPGNYQIYADVVAEVAATNTIHRARLTTHDPLQIVPGN